MMQKKICSGIIFATIFIFISTICTANGLCLASQSADRNNTILTPINLLLLNDVELRLLKNNVSNTATITSQETIILDDQSFNKPISLQLDGEGEFEVSYSQQDGFISLFIKDSLGQILPVIIAADMLNPIRGAFEGSKIGAFSENISKPQFEPTITFILVCAGIVLTMVAAYSTAKSYLDSNSKVVSFEIDHKILEDKEKNIYICTASEFHEYQLNIKEENYALFSLYLTPVGALVGGFAKESVMMGSESIRLVFDKWLEHEVKKQISAFNSSYLVEVTQYKFKGTLEGEVNEEKVIIEDNFHVRLVDADGDNAINPHLISPLYKVTEVDPLKTTIDCDDNNPNVYPGAPEIADGLDNDCNGIIDDLPSSYNVSVIINGTSSNLVELVLNNDYVNHYYVCRYPSCSYDFPHDSKVEIIGNDGMYSLWDGWGSCPDINGLICTIDPLDTHHVLEANWK
jgi:hypothetical protein